MKYFFFLWLAGAWGSGEVLINHKFAHVFLVSVVIYFFAIINQSKGNSTTVSYRFKNIYNANS